MKMKRCPLRPMTGIYVVMLADMKYTKAILSVNTASGQSTGKSDTMKLIDAYNILCKEYLSKCQETGCDGCIAQFYCIENHLRTDRYPQADCVEKLKAYLRERKNR